MHILHKWNWYWDDPPPPKYGAKSKKRLIQPATGWWECSKCHKIDRQNNFKCWWSR